MGAVDKAWDAVSVSFDRLCLTAGIEALGTMTERDTFLSLIHAIKP